ncbi:MAG TPA: isochorismatase family cysteine hydrolase [Pyrinomonadaceae bacterium]|jgi:nicotinamidase-related amidase
MPKNEDLHGNAPDKSEVVLLIIDMISDFEFGSGDKLLPFAEEIAKNIAALKKKAEKAGVAVVYVNDNFGKWRSDFTKQLKHSQSKSVRGHKIARLLAPKKEDYFVLKAKHSAFYSTTLDLLLAYLGAKTLVLTGVASDICILFTANDAYMRDFNLFVPRDCVAANEERTNESTLEYIERVLKADIKPSTEIDFKKMQ